MSYELVFAFRDQSKAFANGFICGKLRGQLTVRTAPFSEALPIELREDIIAMATTRGWREQVTEISNEWIMVEFIKEH